MTAGAIIISTRSFPGRKKNTSEQLVRDLEALGITEIHHMKNCYGLTAVIRGSKPGQAAGNPLRYGRTANS